MCEYSHPPCLSQDVQMLRKVAACEAAACLETGDWVSEISPGYAKLFIIHVFFSTKKISTYEAWMEPTGRVGPPISWSRTPWDYRWHWYLYQYSFFNGHLGYCYKPCNHYIRYNTCNHYIRYNPDKHHATIDPSRGLNKGVWWFTTWPSVPSIAANDGWRQSVSWRSGLAGGVLFHKMKLCVLFIASS
jgi:hypothetical protein